MWLPKAPLSAGVGYLVRQLGGVAGWVFGRCRGARQVIEYPVISGYQSANYFLCGRDFRACYQQCGGKIELMD